MARSGATGDRAKGRRWRGAPLLILGFAVVGVIVALLLEDLYRGRAPGGTAGGPAGAAATAQPGPIASWFRRLFGGDSSRASGGAARPASGAPSSPRQTILGDPAAASRPGASPLDPGPEQPVGDLQRALPGTDPETAPPPPPVEPNPDVEPPKHNPGGVDGDRPPRPIPPIPIPDE